MAARQISAGGAPARLAYSQENLPMKIAKAEQYVTDIST
jgi:hypothetical protein